VWNSVADQFKKANPEWSVELNFQNDDLYETIGLPNLLNGRKAPDIYFEWVGKRLQQRTADGFAADLTEQVTRSPLAGVLEPVHYKAATVDGKIRMVPRIADVSNVIWYNTDLLAAHGVTPPKTWEDLLLACDTLNAVGIVPIASGNKDLWAAGNWLGHLVSRVVGADVYNQALEAKSSFDTPEWKKAFGYITTLRQHGCVNESANAIDDNAGAQLFFQQKAAMHATGSWLVSWALTEAPDLNFDYVNLPAMPAEVDTGSVEGVITGYVINAKSSPHKGAKAVEFLALLYTPENTAAFIAADAVPLNATPSAGINERTIRLRSLLAEAPVVISPADTGFDPKVASAFYRALAEILGGRTSAEDAATQLAKQVR